MSSYMSVKAVGSFCSFFRPEGGRQVNVQKSQVCDRIKSILNQFQGWGSLSEDQRTGSTFLREAQDLVAEAEKAGVEEMEVADLCDRVGSFLWKSGDLQEAKIYYNKAIVILERKDVCDRVNDAKASTFTNLGNVFYDEGNLEAAREYQDRATELFRRCHGNFHPILAHCYHAIGLIEIKREKFDDALCFYQDALKCLNEKEASPILVEIYCGLGTALKGKGNCEEAIGYLERSLRLQIQLSEGKNRSSVAIRGFQLGVITEEFKKLDQAKKYFEISLANFQQSGDQSDPVALLYCFQHLAPVCFSLGLYSEAKGYYEQIKALSMNMDDRTLFDHASEMIVKCTHS